ncbi:MAG: DUF86 domain-containing protein [Nitrospirota bacterium]
MKSLRTSVEIKKATERSVYLCSEIVLDIADMVIVLNSFPKPSTYSNSIYKLGEHRIVPKDFAHKFVYIAGLRNFLAYDYRIDTLPDLKRFLKSGICDIERFISYIEKL